MPQPAALGQINVRLGSLADISALISDVRFAPKADMFGVEINVRFVP
jgi:hypothetical protein